VNQLLQTANLKQDWQKKREKMLNERIDFADFITKLIEKNILR